VGNTAAWIEGNATAFGVYLAAYEHRDEPIVLDDVDGLQRDRNGVRLLKSLCQSDDVKSVSWLSNSSTLEQREIPCSFTTRSRVAIIANSWRTLNADIRALEDRAHFLVFEPAAAEVHRNACTWFQDEEIRNFVGDRLQLFEKHSLRTYVLAGQLKAAGMDWRGGVLARGLKGTALEVAKLKTMSGFTTEEARAQAFVDKGLGCRATYFNHARKLSS
jgi:hypothetical protein